MKKSLIFIVLVLLFTLSGCIENERVSNPGFIRLHLEDDWAAKTKYENLPDFKLEYDDVLYTIADLPQTYYTVFSGNDDFYLSEQVSKLMEKYKDKLVTEVVNVDDAATTKMNVRNSDGSRTTKKLSVDDKKIYDEVVFIPLENGLKLTLDYRRFTSNGVTYYAWRYTSNMSMTLYYPLMVIKENDKKELLVLTLPNRIKFQVSSALKLSNVMKDSEYLTEERYAFDYYEEKEFTKEDKINYIKNYYINDYNGVMKDDFLFFTYLDVEYKIRFAEKKFYIYYVQKINE